jgi:hypothetical protein
MEHNRNSSVSSKSPTRVTKPPCSSGVGIPRHSRKSPASPLELRFNLSVADPDTLNEKIFRPFT